MTSSLLKKPNFFQKKGLIIYFLLLGITAAFVLPYVLNDYLIFIGVTLAINAILCLSLNLINGYMGEFSVGHAAFMALGAYSSALVSVRFLPGLPPLLLFPIATLLGGGVASLIGVPLAFLSFKTRGDYLAIITLAFLMIVKSGLENIPYVGGPRGFLGIPHLTTLPWACFWLLFSFWVIRNLIYSKFGRSIEAIREDEIAAEAMGVSTKKAKIIAFTVSSFFAGIAGALFAHQLQFINPTSFDAAKSTDMLVMVYLGGVASMSGSLLGAGVFTILSQLLQPLGVWRMIVMPLLLVLLMLFRPNGIMGMKEWLWMRPSSYRSKIKNSIQKTP